MDSISGQFPEHALENWHDKLQTITNACYHEIEEIQAFAEAYDN